MYIISIIENCKYFTDDVNCHKTSLRILEYKRLLSEGQTASNVGRPRQVQFSKGFFLNNQTDALIIKIYSVIKFEIFRESSLPIIMSFLL